MINRVGLESIDIGEKKYCLIQETNYDKSEECDDATMEAVNSFTW